MNFTKFINNKQENKTGMQRKHMRIMTIEIQCELKIVEKEPCLELMYWTNMGTESPAGQRPVADGGSLWAKNGLRARFTHPCSTTLKILHYEVVVKDAVVLSPGQGVLLLYCFIGFFILEAILQRCNLKGLYKACSMNILNILDV